MSSHSAAAFNHSCLKVPLNPFSKLPAPSYEQKHISEVPPLKITEMKPKSLHEDGTKSLIEFYDSIPDYNEVNHLSNREFYKKLESLRAKQKAYYEYLDTEFEITKPDSQSKTEKCKNSKVLSVSDIEDVKNICLSDTVSSYSEKEIFPPSRRSVHIESPNNLKSSERELKEFDLKSDTKTELDDITFSYRPKSDYVLDSGFESPLITQSLPASPSKGKHSVGWKDSGITIPKPFQMTIRDEEEKIINELLHTKEKKKDEKPEMFKAHPVPVESKIPLLDVIMAEQELRSRMVKKRSKEVLRAKMKPFSFTKREEEMKALTGSHLSKSSPQLSTEGTPVKIKRFKAKPVPKNLFSNYIYQKMHEDEFYRALKRKIRAEELLKASSLPPSMAAREKCIRKPDVCPRSIRDIDSEDEYRSARKSRKIPDYRVKHEELQLELEKLKDDFITTTPRPFKLKTSRRKSSRFKHCYGQDTSSAGSHRTGSAMDLPSVNRSNLAAVLRIQSASYSSSNSVITPRKRMEVEMIRRLEEQKLKEEVRWRERVMRKRPVWQYLNYSHEEDLAMRLQLRRDEERLRREEHQHQMEMMLGRVQQIPTLFERQTHLKSKTKSSISSKLFDDLRESATSRMLNDINRSFLEYKDEAVQVEENQSDDEDDNTEKEKSDSEQESKEKSE